MGNPLFKQVTSLTGLPEPLISSELNGILESVGASSSSMTLEQLRSAMLEYLAQVMSELPETDTE